MSETEEPADSGNTSRPMIGPGGWLNDYVPHPVAGGSFGLTLPPVPTMPSLPTDFDIEIDDSPQRTAEHTERMAKYTLQMSGYMRNVAEQTAAHLALAEDARQSAEQSGVFSKRMAWAALAIAVASLAVSVVAIFSG